MSTNKSPVVWPLSADEWRAVERAARVERSRAVAAFGRGFVNVVRRVLGFGYPITIYVPANRGRLTA